MAEIITLNGMRATKQVRRALRGREAEIILFPGVFYEYLDAPAVREGVRSRKPSLRPGPEREGRGRSSSRRS